jgi:hypothetical protein
VAIERSARSAIERDRVAWQRRLEHGRARFRQMVAASTGPSLGKVQELLEETEREWSAARFAPQSGQATTCSTSVAFKP